MLTHDWHTAHLLAAEAISVVPILDLKGNIAPCEAPQISLRGCTDQAWGTMLRASGLRPS